MRNQWLRLLLLRCHAPSQPYVSQVHHLRTFTSAILHPRAPHVTPKPFPSRHHFTSSPEPAVHPPEPLSDEAVLLLDAFAKSGSSGDEIKLDLDSKNVSVTDDLIFSVFTHPDTDADVAMRIFVWVLESQNLILSSRMSDWTEESGSHTLEYKVLNWIWVQEEGDEVKMSSEGYNSLLKVVSGKGLVKDTWCLIDEMTTIGYCVSKDAYIEVSANNWKYGLDGDVETLEMFYSSNTRRFRVTNIVDGLVWGDDVEKQLQEVGPELSRNWNVVLKRLEKDPNKALTFFRWLEGSEFSEHATKGLYNEMAWLLSNEDHTEKFWRFVNEMRSKGHGMYTWTYDRILHRFVKRKMMKDVVDLYEFALIGRDELSPKDSILLLKRIVVVGKELDTDLFSKVMAVYKASGNVLTDTHLDETRKSLTRIQEIAFDRILLALKEHGYVPSEISWNQD